jgi:uncharacterized protein YkuJ
MNDPIVFISRNRIKAGMLDEFIKHYHESIPPIETGKPGTLAQLAYFNEDSSQVDIVRFFPNQQALDHQIEGADERSKITYKFIEPISVEIYGTPSEVTVERMKKIAGSGIAVRINPNFLGGFICPQAG